MDYGLFLPFYKYVEREDAKMTTRTIFNQILIIRKPFSSENGNGKGIVSPAIFQLREREGEPVPLSNFQAHEKAGKTFRHHLPRDNIRKGVSNNTLRGYLHSGGM
jgi:hypothetical protein